VERLPQVCPKAKILDKQPADWNRAKALQVTENLLTRFPKIDLIYAHDDDMAQGVLQAMAAAGRGNIKVVGIGAMCEGIKAIQDGKMYGTIDQRASLMSMYTARALVDLVHGTPVNRTIPIPQPAFTKDTIGDFKCEW
jgi:ABC-type sugar transport system substrate-binding protein